MVSQIGRSASGSSLASAVSGSLPSPVGLGMATHEPVSSPYRHQAAAAYIPQNQSQGQSQSQSHQLQQQQADSYHNMAMLPNDMLSMASLPVHQTQPGPAHTQRLTSLMEVALGPQDASTFQPVQGLETGPSTWDGFMLLGDTPNVNAMMGSYDAGISWTLNSFLSESSPNGLMDTEMINAPDAWQDGMYGPQTQPQLGRPANAAVDNNMEEAQWPGKSAGQPVFTNPRMLPLPQPLSWQPVIEEAREARPGMASIWPIQPVNEAVRASILAALNGSNGSISCSTSRPEITDASLPSAEALDFFLRLYIQHLQPRFPVLHLPTFDTYTTAPLLLTSMMIVGSSHSQADSAQFARLIFPHVRVALMHMQELDTNYVSPIFSAPLKSGKSNYIAAPLRR